RFARELGVLHEHGQVALDRALARHDEHDEARAVRFDLARELADQFGVTGGRYASNALPRGLSRRARQLELAPLASLAAFPLAVDAAAEREAGVGDELQHVHVALRPAPRSLRAAEFLRRA